PAHSQGGGVKARIIVKIGVHVRIDLAHLLVAVPDESVVFGAERMVETHVQQVPVVAQAPRIDQVIGDTGAIRQRHHSGDVVPDSRADARLRDDVAWKRIAGSIGPGRERIEDLARLLREVPVALRLDGRGADLRSTLALTISLPVEKPEGLV